MKIASIPGIVTVALIAALGFSCSSDLPNPPPAATKPAPGGQTVSEDLFHQVNSWRISHGAKPLQRHPGLDQLAREHSEFLRRNRSIFEENWKKLSHAGFSSRAKIMQRDYHMGFCAENVVTAFDNGARPAPRLLAFWADSKGHEKNMKSKRWTHTGVAVAIDEDGTLFATQLFAAENPAMNR